MSSSDYGRVSGRPPVESWQELLKPPTDLDFRYEPPILHHGAEGSIKYSNLARGLVFQPLDSGQANPLPTGGYTVSEAPMSGPAAVLRTGPAERSPQVGAGPSLPRVGSAPVGDPGLPGPRLPGKIPGALGALLMLIQALDELVEKPQRVLPPKPEAGPDVEPEWGVSSADEDGMPEPKRPDPNTRRLTTVEKSPPVAPETEDNGENYEGCNEEWAEARKKCEEGFRGPRGQGPYSRPIGRRKWTLNDCMESNVSARCGGKPLKEGLSGAERAKRNNEMIQKKRKDRESGNGSAD